MASKTKQSVVMTESQLVNFLIEYLLYKKIFCWRTNNTPTYDAKRQIYRSMPKFAMHGVPDISGICPNGRALFIEVKLEKGRPSSAQNQFIKRATDSGALAFIARNAQDIHNAFQEAGYRDFGRYVRPDAC